METTMKDDDDKNEDSETEVPAGKETRSFAEMLADAKAAEDPDVKLKAFIVWLDGHDITADVTNDVGEQIDPTTYAMNEIRRWADELIALGADRMDRDRFAKRVHSKWSDFAQSSVKAVWNDLAKAPNNDADGHADGALDTALVEQLEPWGESVNGNDLADRVHKHLSRFVVFDVPKVDADTVTLWVMASYFMDVWEIFPKLVVTSPTKRCGKTSLLTSIGAIGYRPLIAANITKAFFCRAVDAYQPTMLIDEADMFLANDESGLSGVLNAGHTRKTAYIGLVDKIDDKQVPVKQFVWCPQIFGGIGRKWISDTLADRSIIINLRRKKTSQRPDRLTRRTDVAARSVVLRWH